ncbi:MAG: spore coat U domain-containing protein [Bdellovibrionaceae bacterium]|nr:spore coat U domain-containing protein [Pseudobdellovibrionaceae bacterium]
MKKLLFALALTIASTAMVSRANAATLLLRGEILTACTLNSIDTSAFPGANINLPILTGTASTSVARASVTCNNLAGYTIDATSGNGLGRLVNTTNPTSYTDYQLELSGIGSSGFQSLSNIPSSLKTTALASPIVNEQSTISVRVFPIATAAAAGTYEDTVTVILTAL